MNHLFSYQDTLIASEKINWRVEDLIGGDKQLDFAHPFMPESLAQTESLRFLTPIERRTLNQIRGFEYLCLFGLVEEFILPFVVDHARNQPSGDDYRIRALLGFAAEEAKHIHLFKRFRAAFDAGFVTSCAVIGPAEAIAKEVLKHEPLAVAITILHIEWLTQRHYLESVAEDRVLDPQFKSLLRHHWMEEAQHAKLDTLMVEALAEGRDKPGILGAVEGYLEIGGYLDAGLMQQVTFNREALERAIGRTLDGSERAAYGEAQQRAVRWTYLGSGMTHPSFLSTLGALAPEARERVTKVAPAFC